MRRPWLLLLVLTLSACAGRGHTPPAPSPVPAPVAATAQEPEPQAAVAVAVADEELPGVPHAAELRNAISQWIAENPEAEFDETARQANRLLRRLGYPLTLDAAKLLRKGSKRLRLKAGGRTFVFESGRELSASTEVCGERYLRIPGRFVGRQEAVLVLGGKEYPFSLKGFGRERFRILRGNKVISTLHSPEPTEPIGLVSSGRAFYLRFSLNEADVAQWWHRLSVHQPALLDEDPYMVLRVEAQRLYFDENLEHLPTQEFEVEESKGATFRWRFQPSQLVLELNSSCG